MREVAIMIKFLRIEQVQVLFLYAQCLIDVIFAAA